jgi:glyoxylase-like metal-dependent hydrolase (beta-lactamase superfamily II)
MRNPMNELNIATFTSRGFEENGYLVWRTGEKSAVAIDPGADAHAFQHRLVAEKLDLEAIILTHAHVDHIEGVPALVKATGAPVYLHDADRPLYDRARDQAAMFGMRVESMPEIAHRLEHGQSLDVAAIRFQVKHVPGHSPGHVILVVEGEDVAFVGDVIFLSSVGRTDLWGGDFAQLAEGIRRNIFELPDDVILYSGHGPPTTVGHERTTNPFLVPSYGGGLA